MNKTFPKDNQTHFDIYSQITRPALWWLSARSARPVFVESVGGKRGRGAASPLSVLSHLNNAASPRPPHHHLWTFSHGSAAGKSDNWWGCCTVRETLFFFPSLETPIQPHWNFNKLFDSTCVDICRYLIGWITSMLHSGTWTVFIFDLNGSYDNEKVCTPERGDQACRECFCSYESARLHESNSNNVWSRHYVAFLFLTQTLWWR